MNTLNSHWTCAVANIKEKEIKNYDSCKVNGEIHVNSLIIYLKDEWNDKKENKRNDWNGSKKIGHTSDVPFQPNSEFFARTCSQSQLS